MRFPLLALCTSLLSTGASLANAAQIPFHDEANLDNSNLILASLHALGRSWWTAYAPNGHAVVPATVAPGTLLYHTGRTGSPPTTMEWFAFDSEHAYAFSGSRGGVGSTLYTYAAERTLRLLYFDGFSAAKTKGGQMGTQDIIAFGSAQSPDMGYRDYDRGQRLCDWGKGFGLDGFVREEATFEIIYCDFMDGVVLVDSTVTDAPVARSVGNEGNGPPIPPPRDRIEPSPYQKQARWSFYHAAAWHHHAPDARFKVYPAYTVSLYDPAYTSLAETHRLPRRDHHLRDMSPADIAAYMTELEDMTVRWNRASAADFTGVDWSAIAQALVDRNADRLSEMRAVLRGPTANTTELVAHVRLVAFALVMPYVDGPHALAPSSSAASRTTALAAARTKCPHAFTGHLRLLAPMGLQEARLADAVEGVLGRICTFSIDVLSEALAALETPTTTGRDAMIARWVEELDELMGWLAWPVWQRCERLCAWDEQCFIPMWPILMRDPRSPPEDDSADELVPRCVRMEELSF